MDGDKGNIFSCFNVRCLGALQYIIKSRNNTQYSTKKSAKRQYSNTWQTLVNKEISTSAEFCTREKGDLDNTTSTWTKRTLKQWALELSRFYCIFSVPEHEQDAAESTTQFKWS